MRELVIRLGVVACVAAAAFIGASRLDDSIAVFDFRADLNASATYRDRAYLPTDLAGTPELLEDARLRMPRDAAYRVVEGPRAGAETRRYARFFLLGLLLPRRQTSSESAPFVFCYGCTRSTLGQRVHVLARSDDLLFGRTS